MTRKATKGVCSVCGKEYTRSGMGKHLVNCLTKQPAESIKGGQRSSLLLRVTGRYASDYWLHLWVDDRATFDTLDLFLRNIWLECCGHMSHFYVGRQSINMQACLSRSLRTGDEIDYDYDMGDTTGLRIKVLGGYQGLPASGEPITLLARNQPPEIRCDDCEQQPAVGICTGCYWEGDGWLCQQCATGHSCEDEASFLPIPNSPRAGVCAYFGE